MEFIKSLVRRAKVKKKKREVAGHTAFDSI